jgi:hypothetical protein
MVLSLFLEIGPDEKWTKSLQGLQIVKLIIKKLFNLWGSVFHPKNK